MQALDQADFERWANCTLHYTGKGGETRDISCCGYVISSRSLVLGEMTRLAMEEDDCAMKSISRCNLHLSNDAIDCDTMQATLAFLHVQNPPDVHDVAVLECLMYLAYAGLDALVDALWGLYQQMDEQQGLDLLRFTANTFGSLTLHNVRSQWRDMVAIDSLKSLSMKIEFFYRLFSKTTTAGRDDPKVLRDMAAESVADVISTELYSTPNGSSLVFWMLEDPDQRMPVLLSVLPLPFLMAACADASTCNIVDVRSCSDDHHIIKYSVVHGSGPPKRHDMTKAMNAVDRMLMRSRGNMLALDVYQPMHVIDSLISLPFQMPLPCSIRQRNSLRLDFVAQFHAVVQLTLTKRCKSERAVVEVRLTCSKIRWFDSVNATLCVKDAPVPSASYSLIPLIRQEQPLGKTTLTATFPTLANAEGVIVVARAESV